MSHGMLVTHVGSPRPTVGFLPLHALLRKRKKSWLRIIFLDVILFKIPRGKEVVRARNTLELTYDETSFVSSVKPFTTFIKMKEKAKKKDFYLSKSLARHVWEISCFPTAIISFMCALDVIFRKGTIYVYCTDWLIRFIAHATDPVSSFSIPVTASLPPLEWPLSHQSGSYELRIEVQPKPHHRAHYETEGSRGAVKAPTGGHPVVQVWTWILFILCPWFFY